MKGPTTFSLLGPLTITSPDGEASHPTGREARVLAALLLYPNRPVPIRELVEIVWPDDQPTSPDTALHNVVYRLRRMLAESGVDTEVDKEVDGYVLRADPSLIDVTQFESLLFSAEDASEDRTRELLDEALAMWQGEPLGGTLNDSRFFHAETERLGALRWIALEDRIACDLRAGRHRELIPELIGLTTRSPIRESLWAFLIVALYQSGQRGRAYQTYQRAADSLAGELGIAPGRRLEELAQAVVDQDDALIAQLADGWRSGVAASGAP